MCGSEGRRFLGEGDIAEGEGEWGMLLGLIDWDRAFHYSKLYIMCFWC